MKIFFVSENPDKAAELRSYLGDGFAVSCVTPSRCEIQADVSKVALAKVADYAGPEMPLVADDTGLAIDVLGGVKMAPFVRHLLDGMGAAAIADLVVRHGGSTFATMIVAVAYRDGVEYHVEEEWLPGSIVSPPRGGGHGFDSIFQPVGSSKTLGEMSGYEREVFSPRARAADKLSTFLAQPQ